MVALVQAVVMFVAVKYVQSQYYDIFQNFNLKSPGSRIEDLIVFPDEISFISKPLNEDNSAINRHKPKNKQPAKLEDSSNTPYFLDRNDNIPKRKQTTANNYYFTTERNFRTTKKDSSRGYDSTDYKYKDKAERNNSYTGSTNTKRYDSNTEDHRRWITDNNKSNRNFEITGTNAAKPNSNTPRPNYGTRPHNTNTRPNKPTNRPQIHTTQSNYPSTGIDHDIDKIYNHQNTNFKPNGFNYYNTPTIRPGVRPANVDLNKPPITNKPPSNYDDPREGEGDGYSGASDAEPKVSKGVDTDNMRSAEKRRYIELAERMCDKYKASTLKKIEAIPLLPSPEQVAININVSSCRPANVPLVVGGKAATIKEFPHMALIGWTKKDGGYSWKCGGSLISDRFVLTAAHCTFYDKDDTVVSFTPRVVQLGSSYRDDGSALVVKVHSIIQHPKYMRRRTYYDIALLKLADLVTFSETVKPACLGEPPRAGEPVIATGWGRTESSSTSLELRSVSVTVWDIKECRKVLGSSLRTPEGLMSDNQMCAGERNGGKDTCVGDSGGPVQIQDGCTWRVVAITSGGKACGAPQTPAWYAVFNKAFIAAEVFNTDKDRLNCKDTEEHYTGIIDQDGNEEHDIEHSNQNTREEYVDSYKPAIGIERGVGYMGHDVYSNKPEVGVNRGVGNVNNNNRLNNRKYNNNYSRDDSGQISNNGYKTDFYNRNSGASNSNRFDNNKDIFDFDNSRVEYKTESNSFNTNSRNKYNNQNSRWYNT